MRVLLVSDLHYRLRQFDWLLGVASDLDVLVIAGDLLDIRSPLGLDVQAIAVSTALRALAAKTVLFAASGNHDLDAPAPGSSTQDSSSVPCRRTSRSIWTRTPPPGPRRRSAPPSS